MSDTVEFIVTGICIGAGGAALMDIWGLVLRRRFNIATLDYAMLGRWLGYFPRGRFVHERIASAPAIRGERPLGWLAHYAIGITFALLLLSLSGLGWAHSPTLWPPLAIGVGTVAAPWFLMQPGMGAGVAGSRSVNPGATRIRNLGTHAVFGVGLYISALALTFV
jgi:hypothetical protein